MVSLLADLVSSRRIYADALSAAAAAATSLGLFLEVRSDFRELRRIHRLNRASGAKTAPMYDVRNGPIPADARWFALVDGSGEVVGTSCCRLYDWRDTNAQEEIESGRAFSPYPDIARQTCCDVPDEAASIRGLVAHDGGMWVAPPWRGLRPGGIRLVRLLSETDRFYAAWLGAESVWSIMDRALVDRGKHRDYGYTRAVPGTAIEWPGLPTRWGYLVTSDLGEIRAAAETRLAAGPVAAVAS